jgi:CBS domain-containing protein
MLITDIMKHEPDYLLPHASSRAAARRMRDRNLGFLPVCDRHRRVIGMITDRDIALRVVAEGLQYDLPVGDVMTREVVACHPEDDLPRVERLMAASHKSRLVVLDQEGRLAGVVSLSDITDHDLENAADIIARVAEREMTGSAHSLP